jgi:hypothetical protein
LQQIDTVLCVDDAQVKSLLDNVDTRLMGEVLDGPYIMSARGGGGSKLDVPFGIKTDTQVGPDGT